MAGVNRADLIFAADHVVDHRYTSSGALEYLMRWSGFSPEFDSWEPPANLVTPELISEYWGLAGSPRAPSDSDVLDPGARVSSRPAAAVALATIQPQLSGRIPWLIRVVGQLPSFALPSIVTL